MLRFLVRQPAALLARGQPHSTIRPADGGPLARIAILLVAIGFSIAGSASAADTVPALPATPVAAAMAASPVDAPIETPPPDDTSPDWLGAAVEAPSPPADVLEGIPDLDSVDVAAILRGPAPDLAAGVSVADVRVKRPAAPVNAGEAPAPPPGQRFADVNITFYDCSVQEFCGKMYGGLRVYEGAAACSFDIPLGIRFRIVGDPTGHVYRCDDRGVLPNTWVDIFFFNQPDGRNWQSDVGRFGTIEILGPSVSR
jgi:hypothetical protein